MEYASKDIRNILVAGHAGCGKTTLTESLLYLSGATERMGRVEDGTTASDFDPEEARRKASLNSSVIPVESNGTKFNLIDVPGLFDFETGAAEGITAAESVLICVSGRSGVTVGAEKAYKLALKNNKARMVFVTKSDLENSDYFKILEQLKIKFGPSICPCVVPARLDDGTVAYINLFSQKAFKYESGKQVQIDLPDIGHRFEGLIQAMYEAIAETDETLMEKFFEGEPFTTEEIVTGMAAGVRTGQITPVFCGSAVNLQALDMLLYNMKELLPSAATAAVVGENADSEPVEITVDDTAPTCAYVFKTVADPFVGKLSFIKVLSGKVVSDLSLRNMRTSSTDKLGRMYTMCGKKNTEVKEACCGDIVAIGKMEWKTGDTVCDPKNEVELPAIKLAEPCYSMAISPKTKGQDDKVASGLARLNEEDISFTLVNNAETHQMVVSGAGDIQIGVLCSKLKNLYNVETELKPARVAYREKIKGKVEAHGRHKKQSGGSGQFGDVWIRFEPNEESEEMVFAEEVFGGSVPKNFFPSVEKGLRNAVVKGVLAGYPLVGLKATLYDGSYHPVDSNDMAFQTAARLAYQDGIPKAKPTILEPIGQLFVTIPDEYQGAIIGDINSKRRGTMMGSMPAEDGMTTIEAEVPLAEMTSYTIDLRSMTQGAGSFTCKFVRYEEAPGNVQQKVIEEAKALAEQE